MADDPKPTSKQRVAHPAKDKRERTATAPQARPETDAIAMPNRAVLSMIAARREQPLQGGRPLDPGVREHMETRFGASFDEVRVHTDANAAEIARGRNARAYTLGRDIVFGASEYAPNTAQGRRLLTHELAHVVQQQLGGGRTNKVDHSASEAEADRVADRAHDRGPIQIAVAAPAVIQRQPLNYTPKTPQVRRNYSSPHGSVSLNGTDIAAGTVGDSDKFDVDSYPDPTTGHLSITIRVWPGSDMTFLAHARDTLDAAATSYTAAIQVHTVHRKNSDDTIGVERWDTKEVIDKSPPPVTPPTAPPKKATPTKPKAQPKAPPKTPEPEDKPAVYDPLHDDRAPYSRVDYSPAQQMHQALQDHDLATAAGLASQLGDSDLAALTPVERSLLLWGLALNPTGDDLDLDQVERIFNTAPEGAVMELQHALRAGNGQLLGELRSHAKGDNATRLDNAVGSLVARGIASGAAAFDFSLADAFDPPPVVLPEEAKSPVWLGGAPDWAKGMKVWTDPRGNWNFYDNEHGLTTMDMFGKTTNRNWAPGGDLFKQMKKGFQNDEELRLTGGMHYVKGRGLLEEEQWQNYLLQQFLQRSKDTSSKVEDVERDVTTWNATQGGVASWFAHRFSGTSEDEPQKILDDTKFNVNHGLAQIGKARTSSDLTDTFGHLDFATKSGHALLGQHKNDVMGGAETTIVVIKVTAAGAVVVATGGYALGAAPTVFSVEGAGYAFGGGALFSAGRQGVQIAEGSRKDFSGLEVLEGGGAGVMLYWQPWLLVPASGAGMVNSLNEAEKGHYGTFAFDMAAPLVGAGATSPRFQKFLLPYALGTAMRAGSEIPGLSGRSFTGSLPNEPQIVLVMPSPGGARAPAPFEIGMPQVTPNPSAFVGPQVNPTPGMGVPSFPIIVNIAPPSTVTPSPAEAGPKSVADAYKANPPTITNDFKIGDALRPGVAGIGEVKPYWQFGRKNGAGGADYIDPAVVPFAGLAKPILVTTDEHLHPTAGVQAFLPGWSKGAAPTLRWPLSVARLKTQIDLKLIDDVKKGTITPSQFIKLSRANIWSAWARAKANGDVVPTEQEVAAAIATFEAKLRPEMAAAGLRTDDW